MDTKELELNCYYWVTVGFSDNVEIMKFIENKKRKNVLLAFDGVEFNPNDIRIKLFKKITYVKQFYRAYFLISLIKIIYLKLNLKGLQNGKTW